MATRRKKVDVVIVGLGAAGGTAASRSHAPALTCCSLEAGGRLTLRDFVPDEVRNDIRNFMGRPKANGEEADPARHRRTPPVQLVRDRDDERGRRHLDPLDRAGQGRGRYNFRERSETVRRYGAGAILEGAGSAGLAARLQRARAVLRDRRACARHLRAGGNSAPGRHRRGNRFEAGGARRTRCQAAARRSGWMSDVRAPPGGSGGACSRARGHPVGGLPRPAGVRLPRLLHVQRLLRERQGVDERHDRIPLAEQRRNFKILTRARVTRILTDRDGRARGVEFVRGGETPGCRRRR